MLRKKKMSKIQQQLIFKASLAPIASAYKLDNSKCLPGISCPIHTLKSVFQSKLIFFSKPAPPSLFSYSVMNFHSSKHPDMLVFSVPTLYLLSPINSTSRISFKSISSSSSPPGHPLVQFLLLGLDYSNSC